MAAERPTFQFQRRKVIWPGAKERQISERPESRVPPEALTELPLTAGAESTGFRFMYPRRSLSAESIHLITPSIRDCLNGLMAEPLTTYSENGTAHRSQRSRDSEQGIELRVPRTRDSQESSEIRPPSYTSWPPSYHSSLDDSPASSTSEEDDHSVTEVKTPVSLESSKEERLLRMIETLREEQAELRKRQEVQNREQERLWKQFHDHDKNLKDLVKKEPTFKTRLTAVMHASQFVRAFNHRNHREHREQRVVNGTMTTERVGDFTARNAQTGQASNVDRSLVMSEHIYFQIEALYENFHKLRFLQRTRDTPSTPDDDIYTEIGDDSKARTLPAQIRPPTGNARRSRSSQTLRRSRSLSRLDSFEDSDYSDVSTVVTGRPLPHIPEVMPMETAFEWRINDFQKRLSKERQHTDYKSETRPFYLYHYGYRCKLEAYLNGNGQSFGRALSVFLRVVSGEYDHRLRWPMSVSVTIMLVTQGAGQDSLKYSYSYDYNRPASSQDYQSDAFGLLEFVHHDVLFGGGYIINDSCKLRLRIRFNNPTCVQSVPCF